LAVDRSNREVADLYHPADPAVLRLLEMAVRAARHGRVPVSVCGQIAGPHYLMLLLGLGLRDVSVAPSAIPETKRTCHSLTLAQCESAARAAMALDDARQIEHLLKEELRKAAPDLAPDEERSKGVME
jgi:phosphotransferase system enzyme I (PtsI)